MTKATRRWMRVALARSTLVGCFIAVLVSPVPVLGQQEPGEIEQLKQALAELRETYESQLKDLEERILQLEERQRETAPSPDDELAALRAAAQQTIGHGPEHAHETAPSSARQRSLNRLNPEISATGIVAAIATDQDREAFERGEFELDLQANLDPYSRMRWTIGFKEDGEVEIEEAYLRYSALPGGLELTAGRFRQRFGVLNQQHLHALPQTSYPLALAVVFGDEGLGQTGLSANWLLPRAWADANEITLEITDGESDFFAGEEFESLAVLAKIKNYWDLSSSTYLEWGLSAIGGRTPEGGDSTAWGTDLTVHWQPPARAKYRELTWRTEVLRSERQDALGLTNEAWGGYTYLEGLVARNLYVGTRYDWTEDPFDPQAESWAIVPYLTWWQSEWVRLRGEYQYLEHDLTCESENRFTLQLTWAAGPHKHETY